MGSWLRSRSSVAFSSSPVVQSSPLPSLSAVPVLPAGRVKLIRLLFTPWVECGVAASGILCVVCRRCTAKGQRASKQNNPATMDATIYVRKRGFKALNFVNMTCAGPLNFSNMTPSPGSMNQSALQLNRPPQPSGRFRSPLAHSAPEMLSGHRFQKPIPTTTQSISTNRVNAASNPLRPRTHTTPDGGGVSMATCQQTPRQGW